jgi:signal peptidase I
VSPASKESNLEPSNDRAQKDIIKAIFYCLLVVVFLRSFVVEPFRIPSSSMVPTLKVGDHIFVSKFSYSLAIPFTKIQFLSFQNPSRGDVVVFLWPRDESLYYVKRVVGLPGDRLLIKGRNIFINERLISKDEVVLDNLPSNLKMEADPSSYYFLEKLGDAEHFIRHSSNTPVGHEGRDIDQVIPPNHYFVMGDNRDESSDSRSWGLVPKENIKGKAKLIWLSLDQVGPWNNLKKIRWERCLKLIN